VADSNGKGLERRLVSGKRRDKRSAGTHSVDDIIYVRCLDNKRRPLPRATQPGAESLADGVSPLLVRGCGVDVPCAEIDPDATAEARVMRLKGYGNAIVPQLAAAFLETVLEIMTTVEEFDDHPTQDA